MRKTSGRSWRRLSLRMTGIGALRPRCSSISRSKRRAKNAKAMIWSIFVHYVSANWLEIAGFLTTVLGIWLTTRRTLLCWPVVLAAVTASLLVNWYFTPPVHTLTIADGKSLLALLLFVTVAVTVSSVVHLAALRARQAARSTEEAKDLLALAQAVLGGQDTPAEVLGHLTRNRGGRAGLFERSGEQWVRVASSGVAGPDDPVIHAAAREDLVLEVTGQHRPLSPRRQFDNQRARHEITKDGTCGRGAWESSSLPLVFHA